MNSVLTKTDLDVAKIAAAMAAAAGKWTGCNWPTRFATSHLDLNGLRPSQALLMARATAGSEAADWRAAASWLQQLEDDAHKAESEAQTAVRLAREGRLPESLEWAKRASATEAHYRQPLTWQPLCDAIEAVISGSNGKKPSGLQPEN
jgi:hypothetical protein